MNNYKRSPLSYSGSKYKFLDWLLPLFPKDCDLFIDAFGGSGSISFNSGYDNIMYNEYNKEICNIFKYIKEHDILYITDKILGYTTQFGLVYEDAKSIDAKDKYNKLRAYVNAHKDDSDYPLLLLMVSRLSFRHFTHFNKKGDFNSTYGQYTFSPTYLINTIDAIKPVLDITRCTTYDAIGLLYDIRKHTDAEDVFIYCDPPYYETSSGYTKDWTYELDCKLRDALDYVSSQGIKFGLSNYAEHDGKINTALLEWVEARGYYIYYKDVIYRPNGSIEKKTVEVYVCNYPVTK